MSTRFVAAVTVGLIVSFGGGARAWAQHVRVDSEPSRATLVCDGVVVGVTPTLFNPSSVRTCTLFAAGHANLAFDPGDLSGVVARFRLTPVEPPPRVAAVSPRDERPPRAPCGQLDPVTGLMVVCFHQQPDAGAVRTPPVAPPVTPPTEPNNRATRRCGYLDPQTRLLVPCFDPPPSGTRSPPPRNEGAQRQGGRRCGYLDPATHLLVPCF